MKSFEVTAILLIDAETEDQAQAYADDVLALGCRDQLGPIDDYQLQHIEEMTE